MDLFLKDKQMKSIDEGPSYPPLDLPCPGLKSMGVCSKPIGHPFKLSNTSHIREELPWENSLKSTNESDRQATNDIS
jgi:hypothetical protein